MNTECVSLEGPSLLFRQQSRTLGSIEHGGVWRMHSRIFTLNKDLSFPPTKHRQGDARSLGVSSSPGIIISRLRLSIIVDAGPILAPFEREEITEGKYSVLQGGGWRNLEFFFTPHLCFNCRSVDRKKIDGFCRSACTNGWGVFVVCRPSVEK